MIKKNRNHRILAGIALFLSCVVPNFANQVKNSDCADITPAGFPRFWEYRTNDPGALISKDGIVTLDGNGGENQFLIYRNLKLEPERQYRVTIEVKGEAGARFRFYYEAVFPDKRASVHASNLIASGEWEKVSFVVTGKQGINYDHIVFNPVTAAKISFRNLKVEEGDEGSEIAATDMNADSLGGKWRLNGSSAFVKTPEGISGVKVVFVSNYTTGAEILNVPIEPGKTYDLTYRVKGGADAEGDATGFFHSFGVQIDLRSKNKQDALKAPWDDVWANSFQSKAFTFKVPENYSHKDVDVKLAVYGKSQVIFSGIKLTEKIVLPADNVRLLVVSPAYRKSIYASKPVDQIKGIVEADDTAKNAKITLKSGETTIASEEVAFKNNRVEFSFPAGDLAIGQYRLAAEVLDKNEKPITIVSETIEKLPPGKVEVVADQNNNFYIDGKPFFPVAFWQLQGHGTTSEDKWNYFASKGGNVFFEHSINNEDKALQLLDVAQRCGVKLVLRVPYTQDISPEVVRKWLHSACNLLTPKVIAHPALFGYLLVDEPAWVGVAFQKLKVSYDELKKLDPYHPIWINEAPRGSIDVYRLYSQASDIFGVDIYPVPAGSHSSLDDKTLTSVGKYSLRVAEALDGLKPNWMVLQGFAWGNISKGKEVLYPTVAESRFMAYDAMLNNATAISYYGLSHIDNPQFAADLGNVTLEMQRMSTLFVLGRVVKDDVQGSVRTRLIEFEGKRYLIAMNNSNVRQQVVLNSDFKTSEAIVFEENRKVVVKSGAINEEFAPYIVHVYGETSLPAPLHPIPEYKGENPYLSALDAKLTPYEGKGNWIWDAKLAEQAHSSVWLARKVSIAKPVKKAALLVSADDFADVYINGELLGKVADWKIMTKFDVTTHLKTGENLLLVKASDGFNLPCGILSDMSITYVDGERENLVSDATWRVSGGDSDSNTTATEVNSWKPASVIAPYGGGLWRNRVSIP